MRVPIALEGRLTAECFYLAGDFAQEIMEEWKAWLTGSVPMAIIAILSLVDPDWVRLPLWTWALLIFVAGLVFAMFRVYAGLRRQHDVLRAQIADAGIAGPFLLVPYHDARKSRLVADPWLGQPHDL